MDRSVMQETSWGDPLGGSPSSRQWASPLDPLHTNSSVVLLKGSQTAGLARQRPSVGPTDRGRCVPRSDGPSLQFPPRCTRAPPSRIEPSDGFLGQVFCQCPNWLAGFLRLVGGWYERGEIDIATLEPTTGGEIPKNAAGVDHPKQCPIGWMISYLRSQSHPPCGSSCETAECNNPAAGR